MEPTLFEKREELRRVLQSKYFAKAKKKAGFLEFVCEQAFLGNAEKLNEYLIGVEVYERGSDFDPQQDAIVRVQAHEIRRALKEYYESEGKDSGLRIDLPAGRYVPVFSRAAGAETGEAANGKAAVETAASAALPSAPAPVAPQGALRAYRIMTVILLLASAALGALLIRERGLGRAPAKLAALPESVEWFWRPFLPPADPPLVVIPVHPLLRAAHDGDSQATRKRGVLVDKEKLPEFRDTIHFRELDKFYFVPSNTDFTAVGEALGLINFFELFESANQKMRLKPGRLVDYEEVKRNNVVLLGGNQPWSGRIFTFAEGFRFVRSVIENKNPRPGEPAVYRPEFDPVTNSLSRDYALILMLPNERRTQRILLVYGIYTQGSQAAIEYVTNPERLAELRKVLVEQSPDKQTPPRYFQVLLSTTVENYVPGKTSLVSTRVIPQ